MPPQEAALSVADRALDLAEGLGRPAIVSAALDARSVLLQSVGRYAEALEMDERRLALVRSLPSREEQMDICSSVARTRTARGDFAGAIAAADLGDELGAGSDRWRAWPARSKVDALFWWDKWDAAMTAYERFIEDLRGSDRDGRRARQSRPGRMLGVVAAIHTLRGETEAADRLERRLPASNPHFDLVYAHALLGAGEAELALERVDGPALPAAAGRAPSGPSRWPCWAAGTSSTRRWRTWRRCPASPSSRACRPRSTGRAGSPATRLRSSARPRRSRGWGASSSTPAASRSRASPRRPGPSTRGWVLLRPWREWPARLPRMSTATIHTSMGDIEVELFADDAPKTVENFTKLAGEGFYDGLVFHRVIPDFMIQGGCPRGDGTGDPGYKFEDEINDHAIVRGTLAMANAGPNTNGSQFFIVTAAATPWLDGKHTAFGQVTAGQDVVDAISAVDRDGADRPQTPITMDSVAIAD